MRKKYGIRLYAADQYMSNERQEAIKETLSLTSCCRYPVDECITRIFHAYAIKRLPNMQKLDSIKQLLHNMQHADLAELLA
jgi:hypothetical protein